MDILAGAGAAFSVFLLFAYLARVRAATPAEARLQYLTEPRAAIMEGQDGGDAILRGGASAIPAVGWLLNRGGYAGRWDRDLARAGLTLRAGEYFLLRLLFGAGTFFITFLIGRSPLTLVLAFALGGIAFMLPALWVSSKIARRTAKVEGQLVEALTLIANAQRAGFAFAQGVDVAANRMGPPISTELQRMLLDVNLGASTEDALVAMNDRVQSDDLDLVVTAILIHRQTGGNLAEIIDNVTETMRDRERIKGEIKTLTSQQRLTGWILCLWPAFLALIFTAINPGMMALLVTTTPGLVLMGVWITLNVLGYLTIRRILDIDI